MGPRRSTASRVQGVSTPWAVATLATWASRIASAWAPDFTERRAGRSSWACAGASARRRASPAAARCSSGNSVIWSWANRGELLVEPACARCADERLGQGTSRPVQRRADARVRAPRRSRLALPRLRGRSPPRAPVRRARLARSRPSQRPRPVERAHLPLARVPPRGQPPAAARTAQPPPDRPPGSTLIANTDTRCPIHAARKPSTAPRRGEGAGRVGRTSRPRTGRDERHHDGEQLHAARPPGPRAPHSRAPTDRRRVHHHGAVVRGSGGALPITTQRDAGPALRHHPPCRSTAARARRRGGV